LENRVEQQRSELEEKRANTVDHTERRMKSERAISKLQIERASEAETRDRVKNSVPDPEVITAILEAVPDLMPLMENGITVLATREYGAHSNAGS
jgi:hypothetical protein